MSDVVDQYKANFWDSKANFECLGNVSALIGVT